MEERIMELQSQLDIVEQSHSWRLTAPIRVARRVLDTALRRVRSPQAKPLEAPASHTEASGHAADLHGRVIRLPPANAFLVVL